MANPKIIKTPADGSLSDRTGTLQIPATRPDSTRHVAPNTLREKQDTKLETVEEKIIRKHTTNFSLSPSSDPSSPPKEDYNGGFFNKQLSGISHWNKERTKTKQLDVSEPSLIIKREFSRGGTNTLREESQQILRTLQSKDSKNDSDTIKQIRMPYPKKQNLVSQEIQGAKSSPVMFRSKKKVKTEMPEQSYEDFLFDAVYSNKFLEIRELLNMYPKGVIHVKDDENNTLLMAASRMGYNKIAEILLANGADPNAQNKQGNTALHISLAYYHFHVADLLVKYGARQNIINAKGKTAWDEG